MRVATVKIKGLTPYSQSKALQSEKSKDETYDDFDRRIWKEHMHVNDAGDVFIPPVSITQGMAAAASYLGKGGELKKIKSSTWAQNFACGLAVGKGPALNHEGARPERVYCHADGKRGSGSRVWRTFPIFDEWSAVLTIHIMDDTIPEDVFVKVLHAFGLFIGIGRGRPQNTGYLGRFTIEDCRIK